MSWFGYLLLIIGVLALLGIVFFLFAIWRATIGKSGVELKLANSVNMHSKKIDSLNKGFDKYATTQASLKDETREVKRLLKELLNRKSNEEKS